MITAIGKVGQEFVKKLYTAKKFCFGTFQSRLNTKKSILQSTKVMPFRDDSSYFMN